MRETEPFEQNHRGALLGQLIGVVVTIALIAIVGIQVPDLMIWLLT